MPNLVPGASASRTCTISDEMIRGFAELTGDTNPVHLDDAYAAGTRFGRRIAHGMIAAGMISATLANDLPGPGTVYLGQSLKFKQPVYPGDTITATVEVLIGAARQTDRDPRDRLHQSGRRGGAGRRGGGPGGRRITGCSGPVRGAGSTIQNRHPETGAPTRGRVEDVSRAFRSRVRGQGGCAQNLARNVVSGGAVHRSPVADVAPGRARAGCDLRRASRG